MRNETSLTQGATPFAFAPTLDVTVQHKRQIADNICLLELVSGTSDILPQFTAGSHIDLFLKPDLVRQYSLCNDQRERHRYVIAVQRELDSRGGSAFVHDELQIGDRISISHPRNRFPLATAADRHLLLAAGIGVTPILGMARHLQASNVDFAFHYCARSKARMAFHSEIADSDFADRAQLYWDDEPDAGRLDLNSLLVDQQPGTHLYVCGPGGFIDLVLTSARSLGWPEARLHYELFSVPPADDEGRQAFDVELARSGRVVHVPSDKSVLQALAEAGMSVPSFCGQGLCGTCLTPVLAGVPEHRDHYLTDDERERGDQFLPCCSRSRTPTLVLDL